MYQTAFHELSGPTGGAGAAVFRPPLALVPTPVFGLRSPKPKRLSDLDLIVDLGARIGSGEWWRGLATCTALCAAAWMLAPTAEALPGASPAPWSDIEAEEISAVSISPLALGADSGRRMAPTEAVEPLSEVPERPIIDLRATLGSGDGLARVLERAGVGAAQAEESAMMIAQAAGTASFRPGTVIDLTLGRRPNRMVARPLEKASLRARFDLRIELVRAGDGLTLSRIPIAVDETPLRVQGRVGASLYRSARAAGVPARAVEAYIRALSGQIAVPSGLASDDRFDIIIEHRRAATGETEIGPLLFAGLKREGGRDLQLMQWTHGGRTQYYEASGVGRQTAGLAQPVPGPVTSSFGLRMHPILGYSRMHRGLDFRAAFGTPIVAATDGRVTGAGWAGGYGRQVRLAHPGGLATSYSHMSRIIVAPGESVRRGAVIGYVGSTGLSTGPHLHYEMYRNGGLINPRSVRFTQRSLLEGGELAAFRGRLRNLLATPLGAARTATGGGGETRAAR